MCICDELRGVVCAAHRQRQREVLNEPVDEHDAATVHAERAETEARAGAKLYVAATARAERAEAAIQRVRALHSPEPGWERLWKNPAEALAKGWPECAGCATTATATSLENCRTLAALDSTDPPLDAQRPEERSDEGQEKP